MEFTDMENLFDAAESRRLRDRGLEIVSSWPNSDWLTRARSTAELLAAKNGEVDINQVLKACPRPEDINPNCTGAVFSGKKWQVVGRKKTEKISGHAREIKIWALR